MFQLIKKDVKEFLGSIISSLHRRPRRNGIIFLIIVLIIGIGTYIIETTNKESGTIRPMVRLGVIDEDSSSYSKMLIDYFNSYEELQPFIQITIDEEQNIVKEFEDGQYDIMVRIPENFITNMIYMKHTPIDVRINIEDTTKAIIVNNVLKSYEKYIRAVEVACVTLYDVMQLSGYDDDLINEKNVAISYDLVFTALGKSDFFQYKSIPNHRSIPLLEYYIYGIMSIIFLYAGIYGGYMLLIERKSQTFYRLKVTGIPVWKLVGSKILSTTSLIMVLGVLIAIFLADKNIKVLLNLIVFFAGFTMCVVSLFLTVSTFFYNSTQYVIFSNILCFFFIILGGGIIPTKFLPESMIRISSFMPGYQFTYKVYETIHGGVTGVYSILIYYILGLILIGVSVISLNKREMYYAW